MPHFHLKKYTMKQDKEMFGENNEGRFVLGHVVIVLLYAVFAVVVGWGIGKLLC